MNIDDEWQRWSVFLELIAPYGGEHLKNVLHDVLTETGGADEALLLREIALGQAVLEALPEDISSAIELWRQVAAQWDANVLSWADDWEEESALYEYSAEDLAQLVARELYGYDLDVWLLEQGETALYAIVRAEDASTLMREALQLRLSAQRIDPLAD